jgi:hypothetical protein
VLKMGPSDGLICIDYDGRRVCFFWGSEMSQADGHLVPSHYGALAKFTKTLL